MRVQFVALFAISSLVAVQGGKYEFVIENDDVFDNCPDKPDTIGINEALDISQMTFSYSEGSVKVTGNATCTWEGVKPTDRIEVNADVYKFQRGNWQPTLISVSKKDYCQVMFDKNSITYQLWSGNIVEEDRLCLNHFGHVYHHQPFNVNTVFQFAANMAGRHKIVARLSAYDQHHVKREKSVCFQIFGDYIKVK